MRTINFKKLLPGLISFMIIAGMAIQSFATNIDLEAFVKKDEYMTKYYDIEWAIKDIDNELEKTYKFVCTNVRTFGGSRWSTAMNKYAFYTNYDGTGQEEKMYTYKVDLSQDKYLRLGQMDFITYSTYLYNNNKETHTLVYELPGTLVSWRDGIEPAPNCTIKYEFTMRGRDLNSQDMTVTIGPLKKMPYISSTGSALTAGFLCQIPESIITTGWTFDNFYYAVGSETLPTSWTSHSGRLYNSTVDKGNATYSRLRRRTEEDLTSVYRRDVAEYTNNLYFTVVGPNLSSYENIWLRATHLNKSGYSSFIASADVSTMKLTTWNTNK